ncbi:hypothetical protein BCD49_36765 [Pseudofrankia sp. EUN1h]|nr:hypothetical protein BCD49_36765 [Pseudofrankia sp. EUN1h]
MGDAHLPEGRLSAFLAEQAMDLCGADEARLIAGHTSACPTCADALASITAEAEWREVDDLLLALGDVGELPDAPVPARLRAPARARRRPAPRVPAFAAPFAAAAGILESVLAEVGDDALRGPSPVLTWRVGDLVAHLAAGNALLATALGVAVEPPPGSAVGLVGHTERLLAWVTGWPRERVQALWRHDVEAIAARLNAEPELASRHVEVDGVRLPVADQLTARAFETWVHARDIAAAVGMRVPAPPVDSLGAMADLAARLLSTLPPRAATAPAGTVRLTLTGPGGGSWLVQVGGEGAADLPTADRPEAELTLDTVEFCLLVADRVHPARLDAEIFGDDALAAELLVIAPQLSGP